MSVIAPCWCVVDAQGLLGFCYLFLLDCTLGAIWIGNTVAMKTPAATVMAGAHTTITNQLKAATATATETATMTATTTTMEGKATAAAMVAAEARQQQGGSGQLGSGSGSLVRAQHWWRQQRGCSVGGGSATAVQQQQQPAWQQRRQLCRSATLAAAAACWEAPRQRGGEGGKCSISGGSGGSMAGSVAAAGEGKDVLYDSQVLKIFCVSPFLVFLCRFSII